MIKLSSVLFSFVFCALTSNVLTFYIEAFANRQPRQAATPAKHIEEPAWHGKPVSITVDKLWCINDTYSKAQVSHLVEKQIHYAPHKHGTSSTKMVNTLFLQNAVTPFDGSLTIHAVVLRFHVCRNNRTNRFDLDSFWYDVVNIVGQESYSSFNTADGYCRNAGYFGGVQYGEIHHGNCYGKDLNDTRIWYAWSPFRFYNTTSKAFDYSGNTVSYRRRCELHNCQLSGTQIRLTRQRYETPQCICPNGFF